MGWLVLKHRPANVHLNLSLRTTLDDNLSEIDPVQIELGSQQLFTVECFVKSIQARYFFDFVNDGWSASFSSIQFWIFILRYQTGIFKRVSSNSIDFLSFFAGTIHEKLKIWVQIGFMLPHIIWPIWYSTYDMGHIILSKSYGPFDMESQYFIDHFPFSLNWSSYLCDCEFNNSKKNKSTARNHPDIDRFDIRNLWHSSCKGLAKRAHCKKCCYTKRNPSPIR